jgi:heme/copper-type cytochrome/quinol oxidase subunit 3
MARPLALPPPAEPERPRTLLIGAGFAMAAVLMLFGGLIGSFFALQDAADTWPPEGVTLPNVPLAVAYLTLLMSSFTAQWAVAAIKANERRAMYVAVGLTFVLGGAFLNAQSFIWSQLGLVAGSSPYADVVYAVTVTHVVAVIAAMVLFVVLGFRALGGQFGPRNSDFVQVAALLWHTVVAAGVLVWFFLWFLEGMPRT